MFLIVRGPAPSCRVVGVIPFRGRKGANAASFAGRVRGRALEPGVYLLSISPKRQLVPGARTEYARVATPRRTVPLPETARKPTCTVTESVSPGSAARFLAREPVGAAAPQTGPRAPLRPPLPLTSPNESDSDGDSGIAGALPSPIGLGASGEDQVGAIATLAFVAIVGLLLVAMLGLVLRFVRGNWNP